MATIAAYFEADFTSFQTAIAKTDTKLRAFETNAAKVDQTLSRMGNKFSGVKVVQDAIAMEKAIADIGGAAMLTEKEMQDVAAATGLAIDKIKTLQAGGLDIPMPAGLQELNAQVTPLPEKITLAGRAAEAAKGAFGQMFAAFSAASLVDKAVTSVINFGVAAFESAGKIADLSAKTGLSAQTIQRMEGVAKQNGETLDAMTDAAFNLGGKLAGGSGSVRQAVVDLGLEFDALRASSPDQQFEQVITKLGGVATEGERARLGMLVMGKSFAGVATSAANDYAKMSAAVATSTDEQIAALDEAGDALLRLEDRVQKSATSIMGDVALALEASGKLGFWKSAAIAASSALYSGVGGGGLVLPTFAAIGGGMAADERAKAEANAGPKYGPPDDYVSKLKDARAAVALLTAEQKAQITAGQTYGATIEQITDVTGASAEVQRLFAASIKDTAKQTTTAAEVLAELKKKVQDTGAQLGAGWRDLSDSDFVSTFGSSLDDTRVALERLGITGEAVPARIESALNRLGNIRVGDMVAGHAQDIRKESDKLFADQQKASDAHMAGRNKALEANLAAAANAERSTNQIVEGMRGSAYDAEIARIKAAGDQKIRALDEYGEYYSEAQAAIVAETDAAMEAAKEIHNQKIFEMQQAAVTWGNSFAKIARGIPGLLQSALTGGGGFKGFGQALVSQGGTELTANLFGAGGALNGFANAATKGVSKLFGNAVGDAFGLALPGIGSLIGPGIDLAMKGIKKLFGGEAKETNKTRDAALMQFGGGDQFRKLAADAGVADAEIRKVFDTKKVKDFETAFAAVAGKIGAFNDEQAADAARLTAAYEKYGFTFEQIGTKAQQAQLDAQAKELIEDWRVLVQSGIDVTLVNDRMGESINEYLQTALKVGSEIPAAMRPILERMAEQGLLTDEAGNKITDLEGAGVSFAESMTAGFDRVVQKLDELIAKLIGAGDAIANLPSIPSAPNYDDAQFGSPLPGFAKGTGGRFLDFGSGTPAMLHGREAIVPESEAGGGGGIGVMAASIQSLQITLLRAIRENSLAVRDQTQLALGRT